VNLMNDQPGPSARPGRQKPQQATGRSYRSCSKIGSDAEVRQRGLLDVGPMPAREVIDRRGGRTALHQLDCRPVLVHHYSRWQARQNADVAENMCGITPCTCDASAQDLPSRSGSGAGTELTNRT
jgi:hypothetical protein